MSLFDYLNIKKYKIIKREKDKYSVYVYRRHDSSTPNTFTLSCILNDVVIGRNKSGEQRLLEGREKGLRAAGVQFFFCTRIQTGICSLGRLHSTPWGVTQDFVGPRRECTLSSSISFLSFTVRCKEFVLYWHEGKGRKISS